MVEITDEELTQFLEEKFSKEQIEWIIAFRNKINLVSIRFLKKRFSMFQIRYLLKIFSINK